MDRPMRRQWIVLWLGAIWIVASLVLAEEYVVRSIVGGLVVTGLLYWQLSSSQKIGSLAAPMPATDTTAPPVPPTEPPPEPTGGGEEALVGVSGWLALFVAGLCVLGPLSAIGSLAELAKSAPSGSSFAGSVMAVAAMCAGSVYTGMAMAKRWRTAPTLALRYLIVLSLVLIADAAVAIGGGADSASTLGRMGGGLIWVLVWGLYLKTSKRVKDTYATERVVEPRRLVAIAMSLIVAAAVLLVGSSAYATAEKDLELSADHLGPYEIVKFSRQLGVVEFERGFTKSILAKLQQALPQTKFDLGTVHFEESGGLMTSTIAYTGEMTFPGGTTSITGRSNSYFSSQGAAGIEGICFPTLVDCAAMSKLLSQAEASVRENIDSPAVTSILPRGTCETSSEPSPASPDVKTDVVTCSYGTDGSIVLSVSRMSPDQVRQTMAAGGHWRPEAKRIIARLVRTEAR